jgi:hypothetical protein
MYNKTNGPADEIIFDELDFADTVRLRTMNSTYEFTVTNPAGRQGFLSGGVFGQIPVPAVLCRPFKLRTGEQARFYIESTVDCVYMTTTALNYLEVIKNNETDFESSLPTEKLDRQFVEYVN